MYIDLDRIAEYEKAGKIRVQKHPDLDLFIANYTEQCTFKRQWDDLTMMCRGLIFAPDEYGSVGTIVARPFKKFFNMGEGYEPDKPAPPPPDEPFEVTEKMDGSLGILYPGAGGWCIASRGSFTSEQALKGTEILHRTMYKYGATIDPLMQGPTFNPAHTYLFEIIYPENRIVVDYGDKEMLVLLAIIDTETGRDVPFVEEPELALYFPVVRRFDGVAGIEELMLRYEGENNFEGFVLRFTESDTRLKVKLPEYLRLHRLVTGINSRRIWECLAAGQSLDPFLERVPEEFYDWVTSERDGLLAAHASTTAQAREVFGRIRLEAAREVGLHNASVEGSMEMRREMRKAFALRTQQWPRISGLLFTLFDGGDIESLVWKLIRPEEAETPYAPARQV